MTTITHHSTIIETSIRLTVRLTVKDRAPEQIGIYLTPTVVDWVEISYVESAGNHSIWVCVFGCNVKKDGSPGAYRRQITYHRGGARLAGRRHYPALPLERRNMTTTHPAWLAIGREVEIVRRLGMSIAYRARGRVVSHTPTSVNVAVDGGRRRFVAKWSGYHEVPKYLDYITELRPWSDET